MRRNDGRTVVSVSPDTRRRKTIVVTPTSETRTNGAASERRDVLAEFPRRSRPADRDRRCQSFLPVQSLGRLLCGVGCVRTVCTGAWPERPREPTRRKHSQSRSSRQRSSYRSQLTLSRRNADRLALTRSRSTALPQRSCKRRICIGAKKNSGFGPVKSSAAPNSRASGGADANAAHKHRA
jgi:hypothetical protein